ncbi:MAG: PIN domain-containing protein [Sulfolobaceae archaeon]|nr:PIN domain-containing protein [Sulfolobaceae archaeon]
MIVLDTSFLYAYLNKNDSKHGIALSVMDDIEEGKYGKPILLDYVIEELLNLAINKQPFNYVKELSESVLQLKGKYLFESVMKDLSVEEIISVFIKLNEGLNKKLSFTDCAIIMYMARHQGVEYLASFDEGFGRILDKVKDGIYSRSQRLRSLTSK